MVEVSFASTLWCVACLLTPVQLGGCGAFEFLSPASTLAVLSPDPPHTAWWRPLFSVLF